MLLQNKLLGVFASLSTQPEPCSGHHDDGNLCSVRRRTRTMLTKQRCLEDLVERLGGMSLLDAAGRSALDAELAALSPATQARLGSALDEWAATSRWQVGWQLRDLGSALAARSAVMRACGSSQSSSPPHVDPVREQLSASLIGSAEVGRRHAQSGSMSCRGRRSRTRRRCRPLRNSPVRCVRPSCTS